MVRSMYEADLFATKILMLAQDKLPIVAPVLVFTKLRQLITFRLEVSFNGIYVPDLFRQKERLVGDRKEK